MSGAVASIKARAAELDFVACGITDLVPSEHGESLDRWLANGFGGTMRYLHRQAKKRKDPRRIAREARTAVVVLDNYFHAGGDTAAPRVARYARGTDYHRVTIDRLEHLAAQLRHLGASWTRAFADAGPVPERDLARRAGLGWIGKNTMLIRPGLGSWFFIGTVLTDLVLPTDQPQDTDRCGSCTRCLDACPTSAFVEPMVLDATRCISYLTIEHKGEIPAELVPRFERVGVRLRHLQRGLSLERAVRFPIVRRRLPTEDRQPGGPAGGVRRDDRGRIPDPVQRYSVRAAGPGADAAQLAGRVGRWPGLGSVPGYISS